MAASRTALAPTEGTLPLTALLAVVVSAGAIILAARFRRERVAEPRARVREHGWEYSEHRTTPLTEGTTLPAALQ